MRDYSRVERCSDQKLKELETIAAPQVSFGNLPLFQRIVARVLSAIKVERERRS